MKNLRPPFPWAYALTACALAACGPTPPGGEAGHAADTTVAERGYSQPPTVTMSERLGGGRVLINGTAIPLAKVRLASPAGVAAFTDADRNGTWRLILPSANDVRLFGVSMPRPGRAIQAEGYLAVTPSGRAAQLRAGSGAVALQKVGAGVALLAADFDRKGGTVLSGRAPAGAPVAITVDGTKIGSVRSDSGGRFMVALNKPLSPGPHTVAAAASGAEEQLSLTVLPAGPLKQGPFRAQPVTGDWRIDWLTPGGGVQTTVLFGPPGASP